MSHHAGDPGREPDMAERVRGKADAVQRPEAQYEGWDDRDTAPGQVRRFSGARMHWVTVEKRAFRERWAREHLKAMGRLRPGTDE